MATMTKRTKKPNDDAGGDARGDDGNAVKRLRAAAAVVDVAAVAADVVVVAVGDF